MSIPCLKLGASSTVGARRLRLGKFSDQADSLTSFDMELKDSVPCFCKMGGIVNLQSVIALWTAVRLGERRDGHPKRMKLMVKCSKDSKGHIFFHD
jgi:hypothetical protein